MITDFRQGQGCRSLWVTPRPHLATHAPNGREQRQLGASVQKLGRRWEAENKKHRGRKDSGATAAASLCTPNFG